jgi:hypothetical protein
MTRVNAHVHITALVHSQTHARTRNANNLLIRKDEASISTFLSRVAFKRTGKEERELPRYNFSLALEKRMSKDGGAGEGEGITEIKGRLHWSALKLFYPVYLYSSVVFLFFVQAIILRN